ncbi:MAG TPA: sugar transferase [Burkholderiales bacterium]|nr:sugar transferase [Burkholderiales bacterium]
MAAGGRRLGVAERLRRAADRIIALALLVAFSPLMLACVLLIRRDGGPATFAHFRVGAAGRVFRCFKFRTMCVDAERVLRDLLDRDPALREEWRRTFKLQKDPRITAVGRWLRRSSLDELPQLLNVLRGDMALVGPRPITLTELRLYGPARWQYLSVLPGMTGLWQVSGRNRVSYERRVQLDDEYVQNRSIWLDLQILVRTVLVVITRDGAS